MFDDDPAGMMDSFVEGEMTVASKSKGKLAQPGTADFNTLDEPIKETFVSFL